MTTQLVEQITANATAVASAWRSSLDNLAKVVGPNGEAFDLTKPIPGVTGAASPETLSAKVDGALKLLDDVAALADVSLMPDGTVADLDTNVKSLKTAVDAFKAGLDGFRADSQATALDVANFTATNNKGASFRATDHLAKIYQNIQQVLFSVRTLLALAGGGTGEVPLAQVSELSAARSEVRKSLSDVQRVRKLLEVMSAKITSLLDKSTKDTAEIEEIKKKAGEAQNQTNAAVTAVNQNLTKVTEVAGKAGALEGQVSAYAAKFQQFDTALTTRDKEFKSGKDSLDALLKDLQDAKQELDRIQQRAREVLGEATVSGLSERFAKESRSLMWRLRVALFLFFVGIALFLFSAGVVLDLFPWLSSIGVVIHPLTAPTDGGAWSSIVYLVGNLIGKAIVLLPSIFLIAFSAKWYAELFKLREQYAYKFTVAASLPGFKVEAPEFYEAIIAATFKELLYNPGEGAAPPKTDVGNGWLNRILEPIITKLIDRALAAHK